MHPINQHRPSGDKGIYKTGGGLAKFDVSSSHFNLHAPKIAPKPVDTIEPHEKKIQEAKAKLLHTYALPNETVMVVARAGKQLFVVFMLPPYLLLVGLPKWLLTELTPFIFSFLRLAWDKTEVFFSIYLNKITSKIAAGFKPLAKLIQNCYTFTKELTKTIKNGLNQFKPRFIKSLETIIQTLLVPFEKIQGQLNKYKNYLKAFRNSENKWKQVKSWGNQLVNKSQALIQPVITFFKEKTSHVKLFIKEKVTEPSIQATRKVFTTIKLQFNRYIQPLQNHISLWKEKINLKVNNLSTTLTNIIAQNVEPLRKFSENVSAYTIQAIENLGNKIITISQVVINFVQHPVENGKKILVRIRALSEKFRQIKQQLQNNSEQWFRSFSKRITSFIKERKEIIHSAAIIYKSRLKDLFYRLIRYILSFPKRLLEFSLQVIQAIKNNYRKIIRFFHLSSVMLSFILLISVKTIQDLSFKFFTKLLANKKSH